MACRHVRRLRAPDLGLDRNEGLAVVALEHRILEGDHQLAGLLERDGPAVERLEIDAGEAGRRDRSAAAACSGVRTLCARRAILGKPAQDQLHIADVLADLGRRQPGELILQLTGQLARGEPDQTQPLRVERKPHHGDALAPVQMRVHRIRIGGDHIAHLLGDPRSTSGSGPTTRKVTGQITGGP
jgi:hypothetical protein